MVDAELSEEAVYLITRSIFENLPYLQRVSPMLADLTLDQALLGISLPLHPGALRYFKEVGLIAEAWSPALLPDGPAQERQPFHPHGASCPNANVADAGSRRPAPIGG